MNNHFENIFYYISKVVIVIPVIVILLAVVIKYNSNSKILTNKINVISPAPTIIPQNIVTPDIKIDLKGPMMCNFNYKGSSVSAYIKDKKISLVVDDSKKIIHHLIVGDCYYKWTKGIYTGEKTCGISQMISVVEIASQFNLLNIVDLIKYFPMLDYGEITASDEAALKKAVNLCKKNDFNQSVFDLTNTIIFKNVAIPTPSNKN